MDIARYIGLFLLKNKFAYIHSLGNMELKRKAASHDGQALNAPQYDVILTAGGSIDDTLANFIATHEQTSISKAANALRDFATATRADLAAGKEVIIPTLGKFVEDARGIRFITDPSLDYTPPPIPVLRAAKRLEDAPSFKSEDSQDHTFQNSANNVAWGKILLLALLILGLNAAGYFGLKYYRSRKQTVMTPVKTDTARPVTMPAPPAALDTVRHDSTAAQPVMSSSSPNTITYIIGTYPARSAAEKRMHQLSGNGNKVELRAKDSSTFYVVMPMGSSADTARVKDSLRRIFNPKGVSIYR